ncbi:MAG: metallophosphoesterase, partial [Chloroflexi bacterium]
MRYAIFTDIHANLEALEAVLEKIDEIAGEKPIDQIWFLGDLVGYGPNPNECITTLRERTDVIIAGNHDWAAVGKIDLEDFSSAARISAEWTAEQLTEEHRTFLADLPERLELDECTLVHGSPYGPLWEYLTSEVLAERSFQYFSSRYCFVGHTHVPVIFQQADSIANAPTLPLVETTENGLSHHEASEEPSSEESGKDVAEMAMIHPQPTHSSSLAAAHAESAYADPETGQSMTEEEANMVIEGSKRGADEQSAVDAGDSPPTGNEIIAEVVEEDDEVDTLDDEEERREDVD